MIYLYLFWTWIALLVLIFGPELIDLFAAVWRREP